MDKERAFALARRMQAELPGIQIARFPVIAGEFSVYATLPNGIPISVFSEDGWEDERASYEAEVEFKGS
jgi:hypothetical protein